MPDFGLLQGGTQLNPNAFGTGLQQGAGLVQLQQAAQDRQTALADRETAVAEKAAAVEAAKAKAVEDAKRNMYQMQRFAEVAAKPSLRELTKLGVEFPQAIEQMKKAHEMLSAEQKAANIGVAQRTFAAMESGQPKIAVETLRRAAEARRAEGDEEDAKNFEANADLIASAKSEGAAYVAVGSFLQSVMGPDDFVSKFGELKRQPADLDKARAEADIKRAQADTERDTRLEAILASQDQRKMWKNQSGVAWARLKLDRDKFQAEADAALEARLEGRPPLTGDAFKQVADKGIAAVQSQSIAGEADTLAAEIEAAGGSGGMDAAATKKWREVFGSQDPKTNGLYARFETLKSKGIYRDIGPGTKTDDDYAAFEKGWPGSNASPAFKASFLRGMAKAARAAAAIENAQADYVSQNGDPGNARKPLVISGVQIPAGTTYADAVKRVSQGATISEEGLDQ